MLGEYLELGAAENDEAAIADAAAQADAVGPYGFVGAELPRMLSGPADHANAIVSIHPKAREVPTRRTGRPMLLRMYLRWCERRGYKAEIIDFQVG